MKGLFFFLLLSVTWLFTCQITPEYVLTITVTPGEAGYVSSNTDIYNAGTLVTLLASCNPGYTFEHWEVAPGIFNPENPLIITMDKHKAITARFSGGDYEAPVITRFTGPAVTFTKEISLSLEGTDDVGITGWLIRENPAIPLLSSDEWGVSKPVAYKFSRIGLHQLYAWARDAAGHLSESQSLDVEVIDGEAPRITHFSGSTLNNVPEIGVSLSGQDNFELAGWLINESPLSPAQDDPGWVEIPPQAYTLTGPGGYTLYAWARDASGNISQSKSLPVFYDNEKPKITRFEGAVTTTSYTVPLNLAGTDDQGITGWLISTQAAVPALNSASWSENPPVEFTLPAHGKNTLYAWARDACGNLSLPASFDVTKSFQGAWTIMVWMDADNNLEPYGVSDFNEMEYGLFKAKLADRNIEDKLALIVQFDRIDGYDRNSHDGGPDWEDTRRYLIKPHNSTVTDEYFVSQKLAELGEVNMGDPANLKDFIEYSKTNFPAEHYGLILWNHGGGVRQQRTNLLPVPARSVGKGICSDDTNGNDVLYIGEITDVLSAAESVDFLGFDACYMGMTELAYEYRPAAGKFGAKYLVGTPANEQVAGWAYHRIIERFSGAGFTDYEGDACFNPEELTASQLAEVVVKEYRDSYFDLSAELIIALDLSLIEDVKVNLDILAGLLKEEQELCEELRGSGFAPRLLHYFNATSEPEWINIPHFDLAAFTAEISGNSDFGAEIRNAALDTFNAVNSCTLASWAGSGFSPFTGGVNGLGFFFPEGDRFSMEHGSPHFALQYWYSETDLFGTAGLFYGNLDFCTADADGDVESWKELLEYWYDPDNTLTGDTW